MIYVMCRSEKPNFSRVASEKLSAHGPLGIDQAATVAPELYAGTAIPPIVI